MFYVFTLLFEKIENICTFYEVRVVGRKSTKLQKYLNRKRMRDLIIIFYQIRQVSDCYFSERTMGCLFIAPIFIVWEKSFTTFVNVPLMTLCYIFKQLFPLLVRVEYSAMFHSKEIRCYENNRVAQCNIRFSCQKNSNLFACVSSINNSENK